MSDVVLAARLLKGAGIRDFLVIAGVVAGIAVTVSALLLTTAVPVIIYQGYSISAARSPVGFDDQQAGHLGAQISVSTELLQGHAYKHVVWSGITPTTPLPPGMSRWPSPGNSAVSPEVMALVERSPDLQQRLGLGPAPLDVIGPEGVTEPRELISYTIVDGRPTPGGISGFGTSSGLAMESPALMVVAEVGLLVLLPAVVFLSLCLRATARARTARYRSLTIMGVSPDRCARLYASELTLLSLTGLWAGVGLFSATHGWLATSGALGACWWPSATAVSGTTLLVVTVLGVSVTLLIRAMARRIMRRHLEESRRRSAAHRDGTGSRILTGVCAITSAVAAGYLARLCASAEPLVIHRPDTPYGLSSLMACGLLVATLPRAAGAMSYGVMRRWARHGPRPITAAARRSVHFWPLVSRVVLVTSVLAVTCGMADAYVSWMHLNTARAQPFREVRVDLERLSEVQRSTLRHVLGSGAVVTPVLPDEAAAFLDITASACGTPVCPARRGPLPDGVPRVVAVPLTSGSMHIDIAAIPEDADLPPGAVHLDGVRSTQLWNARQGVASIPVSVTSPDYESIPQRVHVAVPTAAVRAWGGSSSDALVREQTLVLRMGLGATVILALGGMLLVVDELRAATQRSANALVAMGVPSRHVRTVSGLAFGMPLSVAWVLATIGGTMAGWGLVAMYGSDQMSLRTVVAAGGPAGLLVLVAAASAAALTRVSFSRALTTGPGE